MKAAKEVVNGSSSGQKTYARLSLLSMLTKWTTRENGFMSNEAKEKVEKKGFSTISTRMKLRQIGNKAANIVLKRKQRKEIESEDRGVWQNMIMMGEKCQPLEFSGAIYYDTKGKMLEDAPLKFKTPRASPLHILTLSRS